VPAKSTADGKRDPGAPAVRRGRLIDRSDRELLSFTISWLPYGRVPEDELLVRFGLTRQRFVDRLREIVGGQRDHIHPRIAGKLIELCERIDGATAQPRLTPAGGQSSG
jgi:hypothetical protein